MSIQNTGLTRRTFVAGSAACVAGLMAALSGCGSTTTTTTTDGTGDAAADTADTTDSENPLGLVTPGKLTIGSDCDYPPFIWLEGEEPQGYEYDMLAAICEEMDLELNFLPPVAFDTLITSIAAGGKMDLAVSSISITEERLETVDFCDPYVDADLSVTVLKDSGYTSADDLTGKVVAVQSGTTGEDWAKENIPDAEITPFADQSSAFMALMSGKAEAVVVDLPIAQYMVATGYPECEVVQQIATGDQYGFAVSKDNPALKEAVNEALAAIAENGVLDEINTKYFG